MQTLDPEQVMAEAERRGNRFTRIRFIKGDGTVRHAVARFNVTSRRVGTLGQFRAEDLARRERGLLPFVDMGVDPEIDRSRGWRCCRADRVLEIGGLRR